MSSVIFLASATAQAYTAGTDLALSGPGKFVSAGVVTPGKKTAKLLFSVRITGTGRVMYLRTGGANADVLSGITLVANRLYTFELAWEPARAFSVRFDGDTTVDVIASAELG